MTMASEGGSASNDGGRELAVERAIEALQLPVLEVGSDPLSPLFANARALSVLGRSAATGAESDWARRLFAEDAEMFLASARDVLADGVPRTLEHRCRTAEGRALSWMSTLLQVARTRDGRPASVL